MLAMQYSFTLPADYDMAIVRDRIAAKGHLTDAFPLLVFKAFLHASRDDSRRNGLDNLYAPFYLWEDNEGMNNFLGGSGFASLVQAFGRPTISVWSVWHARLLPTLAGASWATREVLAIAPGANLGDLRQAEQENNGVDIEQHGALGAVVAFEPATWTLVRFRLWDAYRAEFDRPGVLAYEVGHMSVPAR